MKYYTPDLLARFGSDDRKAAKAARRELERNADRYAAHLGAILGRLPPRFAEMQERFYLHDARVLGPAMPWPASDSRPWLAPVSWGEGEGGRAGGAGAEASFGFVLHLDTPPREFLVLHYRLAAIDEISHHPRLREAGLAPLEWLHDEADVAQRGGAEFTHSILFTGGLEVRIRFKEFDYATLSAIGAAGHVGQAAGR